MAFVRTRQSRKNYGWPYIEVGKSIVRFGRFTEHNGQWPMLPNNVGVHIAEWSCGPPGPNRLYLKFGLGPRNM